MHTEPRCFCPLLPLSGSVGSGTWASDRTANWLERCSFAGDFLPRTTTSTQVGRLVFGVEQDDGRGNERGSHATVSCSVDNELIR